MKIKITLRAKEGAGLVLPIHYNYMLQSFIYRNLDRIYSYFLHNFGFIYGNRKFKLLTFSNIFGKHRVIKAAGKMVFVGNIHFYISSVLDEIVASHAKTLIKRKTLGLGRNQVEIESVEPVEERIEGSSIRVKTLSPITVHSTDENRKTIYYNPYQEKFYQLIKENLRKKCGILGIKEGIEEISIEPAEGALFKKVVTYYKKNFVIEAWKGEFTLRAPKNVLKVALSAGLGDRNSQGFGMVSVNNK